MLDPIITLFGSHLGAAIWLGSYLAYVIALSVMGYREAKTTDEKKTVAAFLSVFGSLAAAALIVVGFLAIT